MVNAHCHLELSCLRGAIPSGGGFVAFAQGMGAQRGRFDEARRQRAIAAADARMRNDGVAAVGDVANGPNAFAVKERSPIRYRTFAECFGLQTVSAAAVEGLLDHAATSLTPHSTYSVPDALFRSLCSGGDAPLSIHFMESPAEESLIRYYENLGFKNAFQGERKNVSGSDITALEVKDTEPVACMEPVTPEEYVRIRDEKCAKEGYVHWDVDAVSYAMELAASCGGGTAAVSCEDKNTRNEQEDDRDILMYDIREKELVILETTLSDDALSQVLPQLMEETGTSAASYGRERGMIWLPETMADLPVAGDGYLALTLG